MAAISAVLREILSEEGSENYTTRMIRTKAAEKLNIDVEELETPEMKNMLNKIIEEHLESIAAETAGNEQAESDDGEEPTESSEIETAIPDELGENEDPIESVPVKQERKESKEKKPKITKTKAEKPSKRAKKAENVLDKLKSYVFKCGVRKIWKKELEGLDEKAAITKVRRILEELGMEGRPSLEKCKNIKEKREFAEEMKIIDESKILQTRLRGRCNLSVEKEVPRVEKKIVPRLDLSAFGDSESE